MAKRQIARITLQQAASLGALALGAASLTLPTLASAQDRGHQGGDEGRGGQVYQNRGDRIGSLQQRPSQPAPQQARPQAPQAPAVVQQAPSAQVARPYQGQGNRGQAYRGDANRVQGYRGSGAVGNPGTNQRNGTDAQREAYRNARGPQDQNRGDGRGTWQTDRNGTRNDRAGWQNGQRNGWQNGNRAGWQNTGRGSNGGEAWRNNGSRDNRTWDRGWRSNERYNWSSYRAQNRNIYSGGRYYSPYQNYSYRRLGIGFSLGSLFYGSRYWIDDPYAYRLPEADGPYRWVRYYDDVLLVDIYNGEVVDAIYDFFY